MVSIFTLTYNHAPYIRQCLDGFLMQRTDFPFEVIINDDASTDGTTGIVREYEKKYPEIIKPIYHSENCFSKGERGFWNRYCLPKSRGKYIALCEGDDYWIDPLKLQKQVDFLEANPEYSMCFHAALEHYEDQSVHRDQIFSKLQNRDYSGEEIHKCWLVPTASVVLRRTVFESEIYKRAMQSPNFIYGDIVLFLSAAQNGKLRAFTEVMSVYRRAEGGMVYGKLPLDRLYKSCIHLEEIGTLFGLAAYKSISKRKVAKLCICSIFSAIHHKEYNWIFSFVIKSVRVSMIWSLYYCLYFFCVFSASLIKRIFR